MLFQNLILYLHHFLLSNQNILSSKLPGSCCESIHKMWLKINTLNILAMVKCRQVCLQSILKVKNTSALAKTNISKMPTLHKNRRCCPCPGSSVQNPLHLQYETLLVTMLLPHSVAPPVIKATSKDRHSPFALISPSPLQFNDATHREFIKTLPSFRPVCRQP